MRREPQPCAAVVGEDEMLGGGARAREAKGGWGRPEQSRARERNGMLALLKIELTLAQIR